MKLRKIRWYTNWLYAEEYPWGNPYQNSFKVGVLYTPASNLTYLAHPGQFLIGAKLILDHLNATKCYKEINLLGLCENAWLPWATRNAILKNLGIHTKLIISQLLLTINLLTLYQI